MLDLALLSLDRKIGRSVAKELVLFPRLSLYLGVEIDGTVNPLSPDKKKCIYSLLFSIHFLWN